MKYLSCFRSYIGLCFIIFGCMIVYRIVIKDEERPDFIELQTQMDVNTRNRMGDTRLIVAVQGNNLNEVRRLLMEPNLDLNRTANNLDLDTPLIVAVANAANATAQNDASDQNALEVIRLLCEAGADVHRPNAVGLRPIHLTFRIVQPVYTYRMDIIRILVKHGAHVNSRTVDGATPLHILAGMVDPNGMRAFLAEYAQVVDYKAKQIFAFLDLDSKINYTPPDPDKKKGYTPLELGMKTGHWGVDSIESTLTTELPKPLGWDGNVKVTDNQGRCPLVLAMLRNDEDFVDKVITIMQKKGLSLNQVSNDGRTTLMYAVMSDDPVKYVRKVLADNDVKATINDKDKEGYTALLLSTFIEKPLDRIQVGNFLIRQGADLTVQDKNGWNLRERARRLGDMELMMWFDNKAKSSNVPKIPLPPVTQPVVPRVPLAPSKPSIPISQSPIQPMIETH